MKVVQINTVYLNGSTGKIVAQIQQKSEQEKITNIVAYRYAESVELPGTYLISTWFDCHVHNRVARYTKRAGFYSFIRTQRFIRFLKKEAPDIVHLHNLHGSYVNIPLLFRYLRKQQIKTIWTLHDCWAFTGNCPYYIALNCNKWQTGCTECPECKSFISKNQPSRNWNAKKKLYGSMKGLTLVTPSKWLASEIKKSFLDAIDVRVINNGIDLSIFYPTVSSIKEKYGIAREKKCLLGIAFDWGYRKGLDVFIELSRRLDPLQYQIVLVGTDDQVDSQLPNNIIAIHRTGNQKELAEIYTAADIFINPTREENYPSTNMEAIACGTPVITFRTGGSPEILDETCGVVVDCDDIDAMEREIIRIAETRPFSAEACIRRAKAFDMNDRFAEYVELYKNIVNE